MVAALLWLPFATALAQEAPIDRMALVSRHHPTLQAPDALSPFSVGNGNFAFTADVTGLQTFPDFYRTGIPLGTQSSWGWHRFPNPENYQTRETLEDYDTYGRPVPYASNQRVPAAAWLRANPHRLDLAQIGFVFVREDGTEATLNDVTAVDQHLNLWTGTLISRFEVAGEEVEVHTACHPERDQIAVQVRSPLIEDERLRIRFRFPYGSGEFGKEAGTWDQPEKHVTLKIGSIANRTNLQRILDEDMYYVSILHGEHSEFREVTYHTFELHPGTDDASFAFAVAFSPETLDPDLPDATTTQQASEDHWAEFWSTGGAIDLSESTDARANELERRIVLSQYLTAIQCAGDMPPQETGLVFNSWFGKSHLEMHWWHAAHFALWNRLPLLERSLGWYQHILPKARETAWLQGYAGVRWPKMVGPEGRDSPSSVGTLLIWQQPHPIYFAELCYRAHPDRATLDRYKEMVFETAAFMASYAHWDREQQTFVLGPPVIPAQESHPAKTTVNPSFELEYWHWALQTAQAWRERLGLVRIPDWDRVIEHLAPLPQQGDTYQQAEDAWIIRDHPSVLAALGVLPGAKVDPAIMRNTYRKVMDDWDWPSTWGWDYPVMAMTAARLGEGDWAVDALLMDVQKNTYLVNGHNYQDERLPIYLPGNGGLLMAVAMMAAGWEGGPDGDAPGFPQDGTWKVRWENLRAMP